MAGVIDAINKIFGGGKDGKNVIESIGDFAGNIIDKYHMSPEDKQALADSIEKANEAKRKFLVDLVSAEYADTASARDMNTKIQGDKPSWLAKNMSYLLGLIVVTMWVSYTVFITLHMLRLVTVDVKVDFTAVVTLWGAVTAVAQQVIGFYFGSSKGSEEKQKMIDKLTTA